MALTHGLARVQLANLPTPLEPLPRLSTTLGGPDIWVKRDDLTGLAGGGNKTRALEFLIGDALASGADTVVTAGSAQSNHARQTAAAAAKSGLKCTLALRGPEPERSEGNLALDRLLGADVRWVAGRDWPTELAQVAHDLAQEGRRPYVVPYGGSNAVGIAGYVAGVEEVSDQAASRGIGFDRIVFACASGGFQAGLLVGARALGFRGALTGIAVEFPSVALLPRVRALASEAGAHLRLDTHLSPDDVEIHDAYLGAGYGLIGEAERGAIQSLARAEGILVDPVYTGRALAGLVDLVRRGVIAKHERVLFWHSGGFPALFIARYTDFIIGH